MRVRSKAFATVFAAALLAVAVAGGGDRGPGVDPNGGAVVAGSCHLDPNGCPGGADNSDGGPGMDPNG